MSANCVLPPFDGMLMACSSEYFAGTALNELSECHRRLPMANSRRRSSRAYGVLFLSRLETSAKVVGRRVLVGRAQAGADGVLDLAQALREGELLRVVDLLVAEHQHGVLVHAGMDRRHLVRRQRPAHVDAVDLAREAGTDLADGDCHEFLLHQRNGDHLAGTANVFSCLSRAHALVARRRPHARLHRLGASASRGRPCSCRPRHGPTG